MDTAETHASRRYTPFMRADAEPCASLWGTWKGTLRWFLASIESRYTFVCQGSGIVVEAGQQRGVGLARGDKVCFVLSGIDGRTMTGSMTLLTDSTAHMVVGGMGVMFEGQLERE